MWWGVHFIFLQSVLSETPYWPYSKPLRKTLQPITNCPQHFLWPWLGGGEGVWKDCHIFWRQFSPSHQGKAVISFLLFSLSVQHIQFKATIATHSLSIHTNVPRCPFLNESHPVTLHWWKLQIYPKPLLPNICWPSHQFHFPRTSPLGKSTRV